MPKTKIKVRAYCSDFVVSTKKDIRTIEEAEAYVQKEIINTAMIVELIINENGIDRVIPNPNYKDPSVINIKR